MPPLVSAQRPEVKWSALRGGIMELWRRIRKAGGPQSGVLTWCGLNAPESTRSIKRFAEGGVMLGFLVSNSKMILLHVVLPGADGSG